MKYILFQIILIWITSNNLLANNPVQLTAKNLAYNAHEKLLNNSFNRNVRAQVILDLERAYGLNSKEPWVYMTASLLAITQGYKVGSWYEQTSFNPGTVDKAIEVANKTIQLDRDFVRGYTQLAWFFIIKEDYEKANLYLERANALDKKSYYMWLYKGTLAFKQKQYDLAKTLYDTAFVYAATSHEKTLINIRRRDLASRLGNIAEQERLLLANIQNNPNSAYSYGNYGSFLISHERYKEAIKYLEKAVSITPYNLALENLKLAKVVVKNRENK